MSCVLTVFIIVLGCLGIVAIPFIFMFHGLNEVEKLTKPLDPYKKDKQ